jgi:hypothetical protein
MHDVGYRSKADEGGTCRRRRLYPHKRTMTAARTLLSAATRALRWANASRAAERSPKRSYVSGALKTIDDRSSLPLKSSPVNFRREQDSRAPGFCVNLSSAICDTVRISNEPSWRTSISRYSSGSRIIDELRDVTFYSSKLLRCPPVSLRDTDLYTVLPKAKSEPLYSMSEWESELKAAIKEARPFRGLKVANFGSI